MTATRQNIGNVPDAQGSPVPGPGWLDLGGVAVVPLVEIGHLPIEPEEFFPQLAGDRSGAAFQQPWYRSAEDRLSYTIQAFLVATAQSVMLVDACVGDGKRRHRPQFDDQRSAFGTALAATGYGPGEISTVVLTHLHVDHVGQTTRRDAGRWQPAFPNARHLLTEAERRYWTAPAGVEAQSRTGDYYADSIAPLEAAGLVDSVDPETQITPQVALVPAPGHTPGNVSVHIRGSRAELLLLGDTVHHPVQLERPGLSTRYCVDPAQAADTRRTLLARAASARMAIAPAHFPGPPGIRLTRASAGGYHYAPATDLHRSSPFHRSELTAIGGYR